MQTKSKLLVKRGRPRNKATRSAILQTTFRLLGTRGFHALTMDEIALEAKVGKTSIYRWWPHKADLAVEAFFENTQAELVLPDTGSAAEDFRLQIQQLAKTLRGPSGEAMLSMISASRADPDLRKALLEKWVLPRKKWGKARMERAIAQGECHPGIESDYALDCLYSPIYVRVLFGLGIPSDREVVKILTIALRGVFLESVKVDIPDPKKTI